MNKLIYLATAVMALLSSVNASSQQVAPTTSDSVATVYFIKEITPENLLKIYDALDRRATDRKSVV